MDGLDEDLADLMGGDSYAWVMQDVADPDSPYAGFPSVGALPLSLGITVPGGEPS